MTTVTYRLTYQVRADSRLAAIMQAGGKLRTGVRVVDLMYADPGLPGWYDVGLQVEEDIGANDPEWPGDLPEGLDPLTLAKGEHARWGL